MNLKKDINSFLDTLKDIGSDKTVRVAAECGLLVIIICTVLYFSIDNHTWWDIFLYFEAALGFIANLAIFAAAFKYFSKETLHIKGIGNVTISRKYNNIQDLTNLISRQLFEGKTFHRKPLLEAYYQNTSMVVDNDNEETDVIVLKNLRFSKNKSSAEETVGVIEEPFTISRTELKKIDNLIDAVKWIRNDGGELDNATLAEIYKEWYRINQPDITSGGSLITINYRDKTFEINRGEFESLVDLIKVAQCILNNGKEFDKATISDIYRKWYQIN